MADRVADATLPGVKNIIAHMKDEGVTTPEQLVDSSLDHMGFVELSPETRKQLLEHAHIDGDIDWSDEAGAGARIGEVLALVGATTEFQFG